MITSVEKGVVKRPEVWLHNGNHLTGRRAELFLYLASRGEVSPESTLAELYPHSKNPKNRLYGLVSKLRAGMRRAGIRVEGGRTEALRLYIPPEYEMYYQPYREEFNVVEQPFSIVTLRKDTVEYTDEQKSRVMIIAQLAGLASNRDDDYLGSQEADRIISRYSGLTKKEAYDLLWRMNVDKLIESTGIEGRRYGYDAYTCGAVSAVGYFLKDVMGISPSEIKKKNIHKSPLPSTEVATAALHVSDILKYYGLDEFALALEVHEGMMVRNSIGRRENVRSGEQTLQEGKPAQSAVPVLQDNGSAQPLPVQGVVFEPYAFKRFEDVHPEANRTPRENLERFLATFDEESIRDLRTCTFEDVERFQERVYAAERNSRREEFSIESIGIRQQYDEDTPITERPVFLNALIAVMMFDRFFRENKPLGYQPDKIPGYLSIIAACQATKQLMRYMKYTTERKGQRRTAVSLGFLIRRIKNKIQTENPPSRRTAS